MNPLDQTQPEESVEEIDIHTTTSVDDFIKELEKDLHITADLEVELSEPDFDDDDIPDFVKVELPQVEPRRPSIAANSFAPGPGPGLKTRIFDLENELAALQEKNATLRMDRNDIQEKSDRRLKDFESYKYRMDRERRGAFIDQICNLASQMLPVLDNLDRALDSIENTNPDRSPEFQQFYDGIILVNQQVNEVFAEMGVQSIPTVGEIFDPHFHEAVAAEERDDMPANTICGELLRGYRIGNRVIRHSMVRVAASSNPAPLDAEQTLPKTAEENVTDVPTDKGLDAQFFDGDELPDLS